MKYIAQLRYSFLQEYGEPIFSSSLFLYCSGLFYNAGLNFEVISILSSLYVLVLQLNGGNKVKR